MTDTTTAPSNRARCCHKLVGIARSVYPSGAITNVRPFAVWIDTESRLIRKVFTRGEGGFQVGRMDHSGAGA
jgi:hypothetical protein